jgi:hypothetical protein
MSTVGGLCLNGVVAAGGTGAGIPRDVGFRDVAIRSEL